MNNINALHVKDLLRKWINYLSHILKEDYNCDSVDPVHPETKAQKQAVQIVDLSGIIEKIPLNEKLALSESVMEHIKSHAYICFTEEYNFSY